MKEQDNEQEEKKMMKTVKNQRDNQISEIERKKGEESVRDCERVYERKRMI